MRNNYVKSFVIALTLGFAALLIVPIIYTKALDSIDCSHGDNTPTTYDDVVKSGLDVPTDGCSNEAGFSIIAAPIASSIPFIIFIAAYIITLVKLKHKKR